MSKLESLVREGLCHEIHTSERKSFRSCRRRWDWIFHSGYYPVTTAKPLEFGIAYHKAMEAWYDPSTWNSNREEVAQRALAVFTNTCEEQKENALELRDELYLEEDVEEDYHERVELGLGMLRYYFDEVSPELDREWTPEKVELGFKTPIPNVRTGEDCIWCTCDNCRHKWEATSQEAFVGLPVVYAGRIDMLARDMQNNLLIHDWKTASQIPDDHSWLQLDDQVSSYSWALWKLGLPVSGFVYHEQRKAFPQPPKQNSQRRKGCLFSVNKNQATDYDTFKATVESEDTEAYEAGLYDEMLTYLYHDGVKFFNRERVNKTELEYQEVERNISLEALDMVDPAIRVYPSPGRFNCNTCAFREPCIEMNTRGDYEYLLEESGRYEKRRPYYEVQKGTTE